MPNAKDSDVPKTLPLPRKVSPPFDLADFFFIYGGKVYCSKDMVESCDLVVEEPEIPSSVAKGQLELPL